MTSSNSKMFKKYLSIHWHYPKQQVMKSVLYLNLFKHQFWWRDLGASTARLELLHLLLNPTEILQKDQPFMLFLIETVRFKNNSISLF